jgi:tRNA-Thr(GGU) m(6)t(6)A37 methyltransferase TsaA
VRSDLKDRKDAPRQADEDAPPARIEIRPELAPAMLRLRPGTPVLILTWLHLAQRDVLQVRPRHDPNRPLCGVFATRSPDRPNPIGLHRTTVSAVDDSAIVVTALEAIDGTPVLDIKPVLGEIEGR